jgi:hypothetical protein
MASGPGSTGRSQKAGHAGGRKKKRFISTDIAGVLNKFYFGGAFEPAKALNTLHVAKLRVDKLVWETCCGLGDPFLTGVAAG